MSDDEDKHPAIRKKRQAMLAAKEKVNEARHGFSKYDKDELLALWHIRVFAFLDYIAAYREQPNIKYKWTEPIAPERDIDASLADVHEVYWAEQRRKIERYDPKTQTTIKQERTEPEVFTPEGLRIISERLDQLFIDLGFAKAPKPGLDTSGHIGRTHPRLVEEANEEAIQEVLRSRADEPEE